MSDTHNLDQRALEPLMASREDFPIPVSSLDPHYREEKTPKFSVNSIPEQPNQYTYSTKESLANAYSTKEALVNQSNLSQPLLLSSSKHESPEPILLPSESSSPTKPSKRKLCGVRLWIVLVATAVIVVVVIGGVAGGVLASKSKTNSIAQANSSGGSATSTSQGPASATATSTATPLLDIDRSTFNYPSIAAAQCGLPSHVQVFYIESASGTLRASIRGTNGWKKLGNLNPSIAPKKISPLAAVSWDEGDYDQVRVYYFDTSSRLIELEGICTGDGTTCSWQPSKAIVTSGVAENSSISAVHWGNASVPESDQVRTFFETQDHQIAMASYNQGWSTGKGFAKLLASSSFAATVDAFFAPVTMRLWYRDPNQSLNYVKWNSTWQQPVNVPIANTSALSPYASIAADNIQYTTVNVTNGNPTRVYTFQNDRTILELTSASGEPKYKTWHNIETGTWINGDDPGGAVAGVTWNDASNVMQARTFFSSGGVIRQMTLTGSTWADGGIIS